ncbi:uncharacterized protein LOC125670797 [Ostrea edulis]|uniref:uncharacterized protein LOC125670797 n=1 Tax=Ostrea edulis TaxID=37623 RepID=UPI0024AEF7E0|nr:uncharacterized protein LOC125670797 [Ostrea edulis]XP_056020207.1 uncharacterized protein LOC125670797 [Ostrea edulis]
MSTSKVISVTVTRNGVATKISTREVANMLMSKEIDSKVKEIIVNELLSPPTLSSARQSPPLPGPSAPPLPGPSAPPLPGPSAVQEEDTNATWDVQSIKLLKRVFHEIESSSKLVKNKWQRVASDVNKEGYHFSAEQCRLKIKGLKSKYDRQKKKNNTSGESPASDEDEDDFDVFEKIPDMKPKAVLDSGNSRKRSPADDSSSDEIEPVPVKKKVPPKRSAEILQVMLKDLMERREEKAEQRHQEKLATANSLIEVLKELAKK